MARTSLNKRTNSWLKLPGVNLFLLRFSFVLSHRERWKSKFEGSAFPDLALNPDDPPIFLNKILAEIQAQSRSSFPGSSNMGILDVNAEQL